jgi:hypothetical protein
MLQELVCCSLALFCSIVLILCSAQEYLDLDDLNIIGAFNFHITNLLTKDSFEGLQHAFPTRVPTYHRCTRCNGELPNSCCVRVCCCFTGSYKNLDHCPFPNCKEPWYDASGQLWRWFQHLPVVPQVQALFLNEDTIELLDCRTTCTPGDSLMSNMFDGRLYRKLQREVGHC